MRLECHNAQMKPRFFCIPKLELKHGLVGLMLVLTACPIEPPIAPVLTMPAANSTTSNNLPSIGGTAVAGNTVNVYELPQPAKSSLRLTPLPPTVCSSLVNADNTWTCTPTVAFLNGIHTIVASQTDPSSNTSPNSEVLSFTVKTISPAPSITTPSANEVLSTSFPNFAGNGVMGNTVTVGENQKTLCSAIVTNNTWTCTSSFLTSGTHTISATQIAPLGEMSPNSAPITFIVPVFGFSRPNASTGNLSNTLEFTGTGIPQHTVRVSEGNVVICSSVVTSAAQWSCKPNTLPSDGAHTYTAVQTSPDGVTSETTPALPVNLHALPLIGTLNLEWNTSNKTTAKDSSNTFAFKPLSYSDIDDVAGGYRYLTMTFEVSALSGIAVENLSLQAINLPTSIAGTAVTELQAFPDVLNPLGAAITELVVAQNIIPTHGTQLGTKPEPAPNSSDFQGFSSIETQSLETAAKTANLLGTDDRLLEYGFVARNITGGRNIDSTTKNYISVGLKLPRKYSFALFPSCPNPAGCLKPYKFSLHFLLSASPTLRVTRGLGETTTAALARAVALGTLQKPAQLMLIGSDTDAPTDPKVTVLRVPSLKIGTAPTFLPTP
jgi:hypothetical protein